MQANLRYSEIFIYPMKTANFPIIEFQDTTRLNPYWSSWVCFCKTITGRGRLSKKTIKNYFNRLVDKDDYAQNERVQLLDYIYRLAADPDDWR